MLGTGVCVNAAASDLEDEKLARLKRGEILLETIHQDKSGGAARVIAMFHADTDAIWDILGYCKYELIYVKGMELCEVVVPGLQYTQVHQRVRSSWYTPTMDFTFEAKRTSPTHGEFQLVGEGDLEVMDGRWDLLPLASGGTVVSHEIRIKPKVPSPRWLMRRVLKRDLPDMLACMRGLAAASGSAAAIEAELQRCPGDVSTLSN